RKIGLTADAFVTKEKFEIKAEYTAEPQVTANALFQSYPNPTNGEVWIPFQLAVSSEQVAVSIYNIVGQKVRTIEVGPRKAGSYTQAKEGSAVFWNSRNNQGQKVATGLYFYQLKAGEFKAVGRMAITR
ncbi:MAG: FlgD immunoglobulin-like domain containing protein, partial [Candidatus Desantisbacteria bacterium]